MDAPAEGAEVPGRRRRRRAIGAGVAVLVVLAGTAAYATQALSGGGRQPDSLIPAAAVAVAALDLDPAADQKIAFLRLAGRLPAGSDPGGLADVRAALVRQILGSSVDYPAGIRPWLGRRLAVAAVAADGALHPEIVLQSTDDTRATRAARAVTGDPTTRLHGYALVHGFLVLTDTPAHASADVAAAARRPLSGAKPYRDDLDRLPGHQVAWAWSDLDALRTSPALAPPLQAGAAGGSVTATSGAGGPDASRAGAARSAASRLLAGRLAVGVHLTATLIEVTARRTGSGPDLPPGDRRLATDLAGLPAATVLGVAAALPRRVPPVPAPATTPGATGDGATPASPPVFGPPALPAPPTPSRTPPPDAPAGGGPTPAPGLLGDLLRALLPRLPAAPPEPATAPCPPSTPSLTVTCDAQGRVTSIQPDGGPPITFPSYPAPAGPTSPPTDPTAPGSPPVDAAAPDPHAVDPTDPASLLVLLGPRLLAGVVGLDPTTPAGAAGLPDFEVRSAPPGLDSARLLADRIVAGLGRPAITARTENSDLVVGTTGFPVGGPQLSGVPAMAAVLGSLPGSVDAIAYLDPAGLLDPAGPLGRGASARLSPSARRSLAHIRAVGLVAGHDGGAQTVRVRLLLR